MAPKNYCQINERTCILGTGSKPLITVQMIQRLAGGGRRYLGKVLLGEAAIKQPLKISDKEVTITKLLSAGEETKAAKTDSAISFEIDKDLDIQRGRLLTTSQIRNHDQFEVDLIWLSEEPRIQRQKVFTQFKLHRIKHDNHQNKHN